MLAAVAVVEDAEVTPVEVFAVVLNPPSAGLAHVFVEVLHTKPPLPQVKPGSQALPVRSIAVTGTQPPKIHRSAAH